MRYILVIGALVGMTACGGGGRSSGVPSATGEISHACQSAGRSAASPELCGCVQSVANQTLNGRDQSRAAEFFSDPQLAQDTRQSDNPNSEAFWLRYKSFTELASQICVPVA
ncbi:arginine transporter [Yoonia sp. I 8.24]|uniref:arginine transporter n=1 Tax=Yoonia sp. I 8.24 TaxID=1537229 RepID=UPI001EDF9C79|nr:arginine transporter [Yoonia sp. I 8.24]MCG3267796.1 arginine transporter [Yoonia sp. I 8.24]